MSKKYPTTIVAACADIDHARKVQKLFSNDYFRVYSGRDVIGVEIGGAVKNIIALAAMLLLIFTPWMAETAGKNYPFNVLLNLLAPNIILIK